MSVSSYFYRIVCVLGPVYDFISDRHERSTSLKNLSTSSLDSTWTVEAISSVASNRLRFSERASHFCEQFSPFAVRSPIFRPDLARTELRSFRITRDTLGIDGSFEMIVNDVARANGARWSDSDSCAMSQDGDFVLRSNEELARCRE